jgi:hypothetical protein
MRLRKLTDAVSALGTGRRLLASVATIGLMASGLALASPAAIALAAGPTAYNSIPASLPGNVISQAFQAQQTSEFGDYVQLGAGSRHALSVDVIMSSWGCESGSWSTNDCATTPGDTFSHPITLNLYNVDTTTGPLPEPDGAPFFSVTHTFAIPYRPSADPTNCPSNPGKWFSSGDSTCYNGFAKKISFDLSSSSVTLPDDVIWTISFNTSGYGPTPLGYSNPCNSTPAGCPYDSLNVGTETFAGQPTSGTDVDPDGAMLSSVTPAAYCDGGTSTGTLRNDTAPGCWTNYKPLARITTGELLGPCIVSITGTSPVTYTLLADCVTDHTIVVPQNTGGSTFDGNGHSITAVDPTGDHFKGAVLQAQAGTSTMIIKNTTVQASNLQTVCDAGNDRLRGILFDGARGTITNNVVTNIEQGANGDGCQEGNAIEVRNAPFDKTGTDLAVLITNNVITQYQKSGIVANGSVAATIKNNSVTGDGPINYIAQNGIQVGFAATAVVKMNSSSGNYYTPKSDLACGFLIYQADGVSASGNNFFNNERNQCNFGKGGGTYKPSAP